MEQKINQRMDAGIGSSTYTNQDFSRDLGQKIVLANIKMKRDRGEHETTMRIEPYGKMVEQRPGFQAMIKEANTDTKRQQLAQLEPGELFAKMAMKEQNMKMQQASASKKAAPLKQLEQPKMSPLAPGRR